MDQAQIDRINALARKSRTEGLTEAEQQEQQALRDAYRAGFRRNLQEQLNHTYIVDEQGNKKKLHKSK